MDAPTKRLKEETEIGSGEDIVELVFTVDSLSIPSEVLESILRLADSVKTLKAWRLVSKSWNDVCCRILRKVSAVPLNMLEGDGEDLEKFKDFILDRHAFFPPDWPNPFQNYKILQAFILNPSLVRFLQRPNVTVTTFEIIHDQDFDPEGFEKILEEHKNELTHLKIMGNTDSVPFLPLTNKLIGGGWQFLKSLTLTDFCEASSAKACPHVEFVSTLTKSLKLEVMNLSGDLGNITRVFANNYHCWDQLNLLGLQSESPPKNLTPGRVNRLMSWTKQVHFPRLTDFSMNFSRDDEPERTSACFTPHLLPLIQKSAHRIKELNVEFIPVSLLPSLPKLEGLYCALSDDDRVQDISKAKFPSLTEVYVNILWTELPNYAVPKDSESNNKITSLTTYWRDDVPAAVTQELLWSIVGKHFPNLKEIFIQQYVSSSTLHVIAKRLPQLQDLQLKSTTSFELFGTSFGHELGAKGWPGQEFENSALLRMTQLTHLELGDSVDVSRSLVTAVLGRLLNITFLSFYWNHSCTISDVREHLGHISNLKIFYTDKSQEPELKELTTVLKGLTILFSES